MNGKDLYHFVFPHLGSIALFEYISEVYEENFQIRNELIYWILKDIERTVKHNKKYMDKNSIHAGKHAHIIQIAEQSLNALQEQLDEILAIIQKDEHN